MRLLRSERGISLVMAIGVLGVLTVTGTTIIYYANSNARSAGYSKGNGLAYDLAEAGIAQALAVLQGSLTPMQPNILASKTVTYPTSGGSVTYSGTLTGTTWNITSTGSAPNPTGGTNLIKRTLTRSVVVYGLSSGGTVAAWSRMYHDDPSSCLTITDVTVTMPVASRGGICLVGSGKITGADTTVEVGGNVTMTSEGAQRSPGSGSGWTSSSNIVSSNGSDASVTLGSSATSANLDATNFGFSIPSTATILGITATVERAASSTTRIQDNHVQLLKAGSTTGITDKPATGVYWPTSDANRTYGSGTDLWGTTWTPAQVNASNFGLRLQARNTTTTSTTATVDYVEITVTYIDTTIGTAATPIDYFAASGTCKYNTATAHTPCSTADKVYSDEIKTTPAGLNKPSVDMQYWYDNAKPGPKNYCTGGGTFPNTFDNDSVRNRSLSQNGEMTPTNSSYTCQVKDANNNLLGEISWNYQTHVMKINGTIFIDGNFRFDDDGQVVHYQGRGIIYASGDLEFDELVCAGGSGTSSCVTQSGGMGNWDPSQNMMIVLAGGWAEFDQGGTQSQSVPSGLQGLIYAQGDCLVHENFHLSGPIVCDTITLPDEANGWPTYYPWPDLGTLVDGQVYMNPYSAADHLFVLGPQTG